MKHETELYEIDEGAFSQCPMGAVAHNSSYAAMQPPTLFRLRQTAPTTPQCRLRADTYIHALLVKNEFYTISQKTLSKHEFDFTF